MPHFQTTVYKFEELALLPGLAAYAWGEAAIEIDSTGNWYIDEIFLENTHSTRWLNERIPESSEARMAALIRAELYRSHRQAINDACECPGSHPQLAAE